MAESDLPTIESREQLVCVLRMASQLEHLLACQYLFAGFSMRKTLSDFPAGGDEEQKLLVMARNQRWEFKVMQIARQEMEHLGIVNNLLSALGEEPFFDRPNFPLPRTLMPIDAPFVLQQFGRQALERFLVYERPDFLKVPQEWRDGGPERGCVPNEHCRNDQGEDIVFRDVQQLYEAIDNAFQTLPPHKIFRGNTQRQVNPADAAPAFGMGVTMMPVTNRDDAKAAIDLILEQGEGIGDYPLSPSSHFQSFNEILLEYIDASPAHDPALPVVDNPMLRRPGKCGGTRIRHRYSRQAMRLFNRSYAVMLAILVEFFRTFRAYWGRTSAIAGLLPASELKLRDRNGALMEVAFFPFMTMVIRPLGDYITRLPAFSDDREERAGPSFELEDGKVPEINDFPQALEGLARECRQLAEDTRDPDQREQISYIADNMSRMHQNFTRIWHSAR